MIWNRLYASWQMMRILPYFSWPIFLRAFWGGGVTYTVKIVSKGDDTNFQVTKGEIKLISEF